MRCTAWQVVCAVVQHRVLPPGAPVWCWPCVLGLKRSKCSRMPMSLLTLGCNLSLTIMSCVLAAAVAAGVLGWSGPQRHRPQPEAHHRGHKGAEATPSHPATHPTVATPCAVVLQLAGSSLLSGVSAAVHAQAACCVRQSQRPPLACLPPPGDLRLNPCR